MIRLALAAAVIAAASTGSASAAGDALRALQWQKRIFIVFAGGDGAALKEQTELLSVDPDGLRERDLLVFAVVDDAISPIYGTPPAGVRADAFRRDLSADGEQPFMAVLIGKDGGIKLRTDRVLGRDELFAIIDAMPMRRAGN